MFVMWKGFVKLNTEPEANVSWMFCVGWNINFAQIMTLKSDT